MTTTTVSESNNREISLYVKEYKQHTIKAVEHYIEAGKVIIRAKKHLSKDGSLQKFYDECGISRQTASQLTGIAKFFSGKFVNGGGQIEILEGGNDSRTYSMPKNLNIPFDDLRNVKTLENKVLKGQATAVDLDDLVNGRRTYREISKRLDDIKKIKVLSGFETKLEIEIEEAKMEIEKAKKEIGRLQKRVISLQKTYRI